MKTVRIIAVAVIAAIVWWSQPQASAFQRRWVQLPASIEWQTYLAARAAAQRPGFCMYVGFFRGATCRIG